MWLSVSVFVSESPSSSHLSGQDDVTFYSLLSEHKFPVLLGEWEGERGTETGRGRERVAGLYCLINTLCSLAACHCG